MTSKPSVKYVIRRIDQELYLSTLRIWNPEDSTGRIRGVYTDRVADAHHFEDAQDALRSIAHSEDDHIVVVSPPLTDS